MSEADPKSFTQANVPASRHVRDPDAVEGSITQSAEKLAWVLNGEGDDTKARLLGHLAARQEESVPLEAARDSWLAVLRTKYGEFRKRHPSENEVPDRMLAVLFGDTLVPPTAYATAEPLVRKFLQQHGQEVLPEALRDEFGRRLEEFAEFVVKKALKQNSAARKEGPASPSRATRVPSKPRKPKAAPSPDVLARPAEALEVFLPSEIILEEPPAIAEEDADLPVATVPETEVFSNETSSEPPSQSALQEDNVPADSWEVSDREEKEEARLALATTDQIKWYLKAVGRVPLLDAQQEVTLAISIETGVLAQERLDLHRAELSEEDIEDLSTLAEEGRRAKDHFVEANLRLVVSIAKGHTGRGMLFLDLIQEGNLGLIRAVEKFDYKKGYKFSTYATWWIRQALGRAIADQAKTIRIPVHVVEQINILRKVRRDLVQEIGRDPTEEEVLEILGTKWNSEMISELDKLRLEPISLQARIGEEEDAAEFGALIEDGDQLSPLAVVIRGLAQEQLWAVLENLSIPERAVICHRFGLYDGRPKTLEEIAVQRGTYREAVRQLEARALDKLRHPSWRRFFEKVNDFE